MEKVMSKITLSYDMVDESPVFIDKLEFFNYVKRKLVEEMLNSLTKEQFNELFKVDYFDPRDVSHSEFLKMSSFEMEHLSHLEDIRSLEITCELKNKPDVKHVKDVPAKEILCKYIIPLKGEKVEYKDIDKVHNSIENTFNILHIGSTEGRWNVIKNSNDILLLDGDMVPDLSTFWKRIKFCCRLLFKY